MVIRPIWLVLGAIVILPAALSIDVAAWTAWTTPGFAPAGVAFWTIVAAVLTIGGLAIASRLILVASRRENP